MSVQDFFELGLVPADTDYRMFSAKLQGELPGIDTAFLLGAGMYHTDRDSIENIRPGTLQVSLPFLPPFQNPILGDLGSCGGFQLGSAAISIFP